MATTFQNIRPGGGSGGGVTSLNTFTGDTTITAGTGITVNNSSNNVSISLTTPSPTILALTSNPSIGGAVSEGLTVTGLLTTDTILAVTQQIQGGATRTSLPLIGWDTVVTNGLTAHWVADPGVGAVLLVAVKR